MTTLTDFEQKVDKWNKSVENMLIEMGQITDRHGQEVSIVGSALLEAYRDTVDVLHGAVSCNYTKPRED